MTMSKAVSNIATGRFWLVFILLCLVALGIFSRILAIQIVEHDKWTAKGAEFSHSVKTIDPSRGQILARDGSLLAISVPVYDLSWDSQCEAILWDSFNENREAFCEGMSKILGKPAAYYAALLDKARTEEKRYTLFGRNIPYTSYKELKSLPFINRGRYKSGFVFERKEVRRKPFEPLAGRTIGLDRESHRVGIELAWNKELGGVEGMQLQKRISGGTWLPVTDEYISEPQQGLDVVTTIDMHLQDVATSSLKKQLIKHEAAWGIVVLMEIETGYVRAISNLTRHESGDNVDYRESYNHALGSAVEPGSTFKLASLIACLESGVITLKDTIDTGNGITHFHGKRMRDSNWDHGGHGRISLEEVFTMSSNVGSALAVKQCFSLEPQKFLDGLQRIGITQPLGINLVGEGLPHIYSTVGEGAWSGLSLTQMAIGYEVTQTPLQTLALYSAIANNGKMMKPLFVTETQRRGVTVEEFLPEVVNDRICSSKTLESCKTMLEGVCIPDGEGTAAKIFKNSPYTVAGKTGTCKIAHNGSYAEGRYRASFTGYFPTDNPQFSCIVVVSDTKSGSYYGSTIAAPVFRDLADLIYATDSKFHTILDSPLLAENNRHLPTANNGERSEIVYLYELLGVPYEDDSNTSDWVRVSTSEDSVKLSTRVIEPQTMPNVQGMGLKDALYLLENAGIRVYYEGSGIVKSQSVTPGTPFEKASTIKLILS
jgi:cell division protein FtsI (penicillin-binding protein 3)